MLIDGRCIPSQVCVPMTIAGLFFSGTSCNDPDSPHVFSLSNHDQNGLYSFKDENIPGLMRIGGSFSSFDGCLVINTLPLSPCG